LTRSRSVLASLSATRVATSIAWAVFLAACDRLRSDFHLQTLMNSSRV